MPDTTNFSAQQDADNGKAVGILSYIFIIGWIIAIILHSNNKTQFGAFHLRQGLGLSITGILLSVLFVGFIFFVPFFWWITRLVQLALFVLMILGIINAANGKKEPLPLVGDFFNQLFSGLH